MLAVDQDRSGRIGLEQHPLREVASADRLRRRRARPAWPKRSRGPSRADWKIDFARPAAADLPILSQEALLNSGKAWESLEQLDKARAAYEKLANTKSVFAKDAQQQLDRLKRDASDLEGLAGLAKPNKP